MREHELVAVAMINGHHFHFFAREDGFHDGTAAGSEMIARGVFPFCDSSFASAISHSPASPLNRSKAESSDLASADVFGPEQHGLSAASAANALDATSSMTEKLRLDMMFVSLGLRKSGCTAQSSYREQ